MEGVHAQLRRLRNWFLVWFIAQAIVGTAAAAWVLDGMSRYSFMRYATGGVTAGTAGTILAGIGVSLLLLLLATVMLEALLDLRAWARTVMLIIGWVTAASALFNLMTLPGTAALLDSVAVLAGGDRLTLVTLTVLTKVADLAFWLWVIYVLQMNATVREAFACGTDHTEPAPTQPASR